MGARLVVVTPWFPKPGHPFYGAFVWAAVRAVQPYVDEITVLHVDSVPPDSDAQPSDDERDGVSVRYLPVRLEGTTSRADVARAHRDALRAAGLRELAAGAVVHAHVGMPTGWAVADVLDPSTPLLLTEHASYLNQVLRHAEARQMYRDLMERAGSVTAVSEVVRGGLAGAFPDLAGKLSVVPNPVDFDLLPARAEPVSDLRRWLYLGSLSTAKGCDRLLEAFAVAAGLRDGLSLTFVGEGALREQLTLRAAELGLSDVVELPGPVAPDQVADVLARHDVLVHLSRFETFGITSVEAVASGLPLVVTRCQGPEYVLGDLVGGMVQLVDVEDDPRPVVAAWHRLGARLDRLDPAAARHALEQRLSAPVVGRELARRYERAARGGAVERARPHVVAVSLAPRRRPELVDQLAGAVDEGGSATLVTVSPAAWGPLPPSIEVVPLGLTSLAAALTSPQPLPVAALPSGTFQRVASGLRRRSRTAPGELAPLMRRAAGLIGRLDARPDALRPGRALSPGRLWAAAALSGHQVADAAGIAEADVVLTGDDADQRLARRLKRR